MYWLHITRSYAICCAKLFELFGSGYARLVANWTNTKCIWRRPQVAKYANEAPPPAVVQHMISDQRKAIRSINLIIANLKLAQEYHDYTQHVNLVVSYMCTLICHVPVGKSSSTYKIRGRRSTREIPCSFKASVYSFIY